MKIAAQTEIATELYEKHNEALKQELRNNVCRELMKHDVFIEPTVNNRHGITSMEMHFFALSFDNVRELKELANKYPELNKTLQDIIVKG